MSTLEERQQMRLEKFLLKREEQKLKQKKLKRKKKKKKTSPKIKKQSEKKEKTPKKRRVGRPKKRGPKKKRIRKKNIKKIKERPVVDFKIITCLNGKQNGYVGCYRTYTEAYDNLCKLENLNNEVIFPRKYINKVNVTNIKEEYLLLEKDRTGDKPDGILRNEFGKFVEHKITNNTTWVIRDKKQRFVEETFWVYGFDPKTERKNFLWIYNVLLKQNIETHYDIIRILVYKNKLIVKYDNKPMSMVMCKNKSDCIRLYNLISENIRNEKIKQIICTGAYNTVSDNRRQLEKEIMDLTGWNKIKIQRSTN